MEELIVLGVPIYYTTEALLYTIKIGVVYEKTTKVSSLTHNNEEDL